MAPTLDSTAGLIPRPSTCPLELGPTAPIEAEVSFQGPRHPTYAVLSLASIVRQGEQANLIEPADEAGRSEAGIAIGRREITLSFGENPDRSYVGLTSLMASYRAPGASASVDMPLRRTEDGLAFEIPDGSGPAELDVSAVWTDGCFTYAGLTRFGFDLVAAAIADACPSTPAGIDAILRSHDDDRLLIGDASRPIGTISYSARYFNYGGSDGVGAFGSWDPASPAAEALAGGTLQLLDDDPDLRLARAFVRFYPRAEVEALPPQGIGEVSGLDLVADATGTLLVPVPSSPGRYVLEIPTTWDLPCLDGGGLAYFSVDVH